MIARLRPAHTEERLKEIYAKPHAHGDWEDHRIRVAETISLARGFCTPDDRTAADLSCGDAAIVHALQESPGTFDRVYLGDFAVGYEFRGPLENTLSGLPHVVDVFFLCETLEHVDEPMAVLKAIRLKTKKLILSTPIGEIDDGNEEHYWGWDKQGISELLETAGFTPVVYRETPDRHDWYQFQIWGCT